MPVVHRVDRIEDLPEPVPDADFVVIDVIISSTSIVRLLEAGATFVKPFARTEAAIAFAEKRDDALLVGEQGGGAIDGFVSPLPSVFRREPIDGRPVGILTSNGTRAVARIGRDDGIFVGTTVNAAAVASVIDERDRETWLVAAGRRGEPTPEDCAGAELIEIHLDGGPTESQRRDLANRIDSSETASWLRSLGFEGELESLLAFDGSSTVPRMRDGVFVAE